ncbi:MAG: hypothetical protein IJ287_10275 [Methanobrevibacter sp.]|nr:hypothetical protein [Methanobrevibacter sp.]
MGDLIIKTKIMILSTSMLILISISCVNATQINATESVSHISDDSLLNIDSNDFSSLNNEINASSQSKVLNLTKDYAYNSQKDQKFSDGINIEIDDLIIDGQGHSINANKEARIFNIKSNNVTLKNLVLINGNSDSMGASIYWSGENGQVINTIIKNSTSINLKNTNTLNIGGAIYFEKPATMINSKFTDNYATFGGAVNFESNGVIKNCEFENNFAKLLGGGVFCNGDVTINNSTFTQNEASDGGAVCIFSKGIVENTIFERNIAIGYGGAIENENTITIKNSSFIKNIGAYAGAIYFKGDGILENSILTENSAKIGGAIYSATYDASTKNCEFNHNDAEQGKSLFISNKYMQIENCTFNNNISYFESEIYMECNNPTLTNLTYNNITKKTAVENATKTVTTKVTKKKTAITATSKTFKLKNVKKYTVTLKTGKKILKNKKIFLKLKNKTYSGKTNSKGKVTFKLKITKKGTFKATINFYGDKLYKVSKKTVYIKIKK